jgi:hypothetical protein
MCGLYVVVSLFVYLCTSVTHTPVEKVTIQTYISAHTYTYTYTKGWVHAKSLTQHVYTHIPTHMHSATFWFEPLDEAGLWKLRRIKLVDANRNVRVYGDQELLLMGMAGDVNATISVSLCVYVSRNVCMQM